MTMMSFRTLLLFSCVVLGLGQQIKLQSSLDGQNLPERDPALQKMQYDVGDGKKETYVYIEPDVTSFYRDIPPPASTKVRPKFNGFSAKFINLSNKPLELHWEATVGGTRHLIKSHQPFSAGGTASFPSHSFIFVDPGQPDDIKIRFSVGKYPQNIYYYDPFFVEGDPKQTEQNLKALKKEERAKYDEWRKTLSFNEQYKAKTGRSYLANYERPPPMHFMWPADFFNQTHWVETRETHFTEIPPKSKIPPITVHGSPRKFKPTDSGVLTEYRDPARTLNMTLKVLSCAPRVFEINNFLSPQEVQHIVNIATGMDLKLSSTGVFEKNEAKTKSNLKSRTSYNTWVNRETDPVIDAIYRRGADLMKIDEAWLRHRTDGKEFSDHISPMSLAEQLQLVHYGPGQEYTAHHDFAFSKKRNAQAARFGTLLLYLNEGMTGGETSFPRWANAETFDELYVKPEVGKAVLFYSQLPDGNLDDLSHHAAKPVTEGEKWLINLWTWDPVYGM